MQAEREEEDGVRPPEAWGGGRGRMFFERGEEDGAGCKQSGEGFDGQGSL